jgi:hypothetical protein
MKAYVTAAVPDQRQRNIDYFLINCPFCRIPSVHHLQLPSNEFSYFGNTNIFMRQLACIVVSPKLMKELALSSFARQ